jgi:hypothetical protein
MANIQFTNGTTTTTGSEDILFDVIADKYFSTWLFCHNMTSAETIQVKGYVMDQNANTLRLFIDEPVSGVQAVPAYYIHLLPASEYRITITRTAGTDKTYTWLRAEI